MKRVMMILFVMGLVLLMLPLAASAESGWTKEGDYLYYYKDGSKLTGTQTVDGVVFYFTDSGELKGNGKVQKIGGSYYYLGSDNTIQYGWVTLGEKSYYFNPETGEAYTGISYISAVGTYYFNDEGVLQKHTLYTDDSGNKYYFGADGKRLRGWQTIEGNTYYFGPAAYTGISKINDEYGNGVYYYFNNEGVLQKATFYTDDSGNKYYFGTDGKRVSGWQTIEEDTYYFRPAAYTGCIPMIYVDGNEEYYCFNDEGIMQKATFYTDDSGYKYYFGADGKLVSGWQTIEGNTYYFIVKPYSNGAA